MFDKNTFFSVICPKCCVFDKTYLCSRGNKKRTDEDKIKTFFVPKSRGSDLYF